ncbi:methylmalonyl-CoA epimerase [Deltaproteobacteria bacterium]|nr:methylmalonyl-CoA epimerase [Deltaproteobacteria bacterium]
MIRRLDHIAIAVPDLQRAIARFAEDLGLTLAGTEDVPTEKTSTAFFPIDGTRIELVHPMGGEGPIAKYLEKRGGGLHHVCFQTDDIEGDVAKLTAKGWQFLSPAPKPGAHGTRVIFAHPRSCEGVLVELAEHPRAHE